MCCTTPGDCVLHGVHGWRENTSSSSKTLLSAGRLVHLVQQNHLHFSSCQSDGFVEQLHRLIEIPSAKADDIY